MRSWVAVVRDFLTAREEGATVVEYALLLLLIAVLALAGITLFGQTLSSFFSTASSTI
jgi:Flp pilus assembly pilin Flp